jgi:hypothetical protein
MERSSGCARDLLPFGDHEVDLPQKVVCDLEFSTAEIRTE